MSWTQYTFQRMLHVLPILVGVSIVVFLLIQLVPGDPAQTLLGPRARPDAVAALRTELGLDRPLVDQYVDYVRSLASGDLGTSLTYDTPVTELISTRWAPTAWLIGYSAALVVVITIPLALIAVRRPGGIADGIVRLATLMGLGLPSFWIGLLLILALGIYSDVFPVGGYGNGFAGHLHSMFLPALTVAVSMAPMTIRSLRASLLEAFDSDQVLSTRAKGLPARRTNVYALRTAILPAVTVLGVNLGWLVGNTVVIEQIFAIPGLGSLMLDAITARDFPTVQILSLVFAVVVVLVSLSTDLLRAALDPRIELG